MKSHSTPRRYLSHGLVAAVATWGSVGAFAADHNDHSTDSSQSSTQTSFSQSSHKGDRKDVSFIKEAAKGNQSEVEMGRLAATQGQNEQVKQLGQRLEQDHAKSNQELQQIAQANGVTLPTDTSWRDNHAFKSLQGKSGADFDKAFAEHALMDHGKDIEKYQRALQNTSDPQLKAYIQKTLPVLREHLTMARAAGAAVGVDQKALSAADRYLTGENSQGVGASPRSQTGTGSDKLNKNYNYDQNSNGRSTSDSPLGTRPSDTTKGSSNEPHSPSDRK